MSALKLKQYEIMGASYEPGELEVHVFGSARVHGQVWEVDVCLKR